MRVALDTKVEPLGETAVSVTYTYELAIAQRTKVTIRYVADVLGHVDLHVAYPGEKDGDLPTIPAFGIEWMLPVEYSNLRFYGVGPEETYATASIAKLGIGIRTPSAIARRICCRRKPATMRTCVGLRLRTILVMACA